MWTCSFANIIKQTEKFHGNPKPQDFPRISCFYYNWPIYAYTNRIYLNHRNYHKCVNFQNSVISFPKIKWKTKHFCCYCVHCIKLRNSFSDSDLESMEGEMKIL